MADRPQQTTVIEPIDPFENGELNSLEGAPWPASSCSALAPPCCYAPRTSRRCAAYRLMTCARSLFGAPQARRPGRAAAHAHGSSLARRSGCGPGRLLRRMRPDAGLRAFGADFFEPIVTTRLIVPDPGGLCSAPLNMPELVGFARPQLACVRESYPQASGGTLQVAELRPDRMTCWTVPDFDVGDAHTSATCGAGVDAHREPTTMVCAF